MLRLQIQMLIENIEIINIFTAAVDFSMYLSSPFRCIFHQVYLGTKCGWEASNKYPILSLSIGYHLTALYNFSRELNHLRYFQEDTILSIIPKSPIGGL